MTASWNEASRSTQRRPHPKEIGTAQHTDTTDGAGSRRRMVEADR
jgi:hypothetical protein